MGDYLLIESRDPFESNDVAFYYELAANLAKAGSKVTLFLIQNGVFAARRSHRADGVAAAAKAGVQVLADEFSLRERGIPASRLVTGVKSAALDVVIDQLAEGRRALWH
jgi:predicted peroxiredoxin